MKYRYEHMEYFKDMEMPDFSKYSGNIILYGAGVNGTVALKKLQDAGVEVICFCDSDEKKWGTQYLGLDIISPEEMKEKYPDAVIIVTPYMFRGVYKKLKKLGYDKVYDCTSLVLEFDTEGIVELLPEYMNDEVLMQAIDDYIKKLAELHGKGQGSLKTMCIVVTEKCTLRCKECMSFIPYYKNPKHCDWEEMERALDLLLEITDFEYVTIEGGETFLYPHMDKLINKLKNHPNCRCIYPITTATIIPDEKTLEALSDPKVNVWMSNYGSVSRRFDELCKVFDDHNVKHVTKLQPWKKIADIKYHERTEDENQDIYDNCCKSDGNPFLLHGKLYKCQFEANIDNLGLVPEMKRECVNLLDSSKSKQELLDEIIEFYTRENYIDACRFCNGRGYTSEDVPIAEQWEGKVPELIVNPYS